jgi:hypothetical protein
MNEFRSKAPAASIKAPTPNTANSQRGYSDMRFFSQSTGMTAEEERELWSKVRQLRERLDGLKQSRVN